MVHITLHSFMEQKSKNEKSAAKYLPYFCNKNYV